MPSKRDAGGDGAAAAAAAPAAAAAAAWRSPIGCTARADADPAEAAFRSWCDAEKILWPKCAVGVSAATGRCVVATGDIKECEVVVEVPDDAVLMVENCSIYDQLAGEIAPVAGACACLSQCTGSRDSAPHLSDPPFQPATARSPGRAKPLTKHPNPTTAAGGLSKPAEDALLEVQGLVLAVMHERALGPKSRWAPYLAFLPAAMGHMPVYWEVRGRAENGCVYDCMYTLASAVLGGRAACCSRRTQRPNYHPANAPDPVHPSNPGSRPSWPS
jgi:hypothetical protein